MFGVNKYDLDRSKLINCAVIFLQVYYLLLPVDVLNEVDNDDDLDEDDEEEYYIRENEIECIMYKRHIKQINGHRVPVSVQLLGHSNKHFIGIKVTAFDNNKCQDLGFFMTVDQQHWKIDEDSISKMSKKSRTRTEVLVKHYRLTDVLEKKGIAFIMDNSELDLMH